MSRVGLGACSPQTCVRTGCSIGAYGEYEHLIGRFSAFADVGYVVARTWNAPDLSPFYQRYGWRFQVNHRALTTLALRATGGKKADAFEVGIGYRFFTAR